MCANWTNEQEAHGAHHADLFGTGEGTHAQPEKLCGQRSVGLPGGPGCLKQRREICLLSRRRGVAALAAVEARDASARDRRARFDGMSDAIGRECVCSAAEVKYATGEGGTENECYHVQFVLLRDMQRGRRTKYVVPHCCQLVKSCSAMEVRVCAANSS